MTSHRAYRNAMTRDEAIAELTRCSGTQFDPDVVRAFIEAGIDVEVAQYPAREVSEQDQIGIRS
jgi:HD-GYP domain-containing protein (c-di-GMP phosphodiesterase class II)